MQKNTKDILKGKLLELLRTFSNKELKRLESYIMAPFINTNKKIMHLFELIKRQHPNYENISKQKLYEKIYDTRATYQDSRLRILVSSLSRIVEQFISYQKYEKDQYRKQSYLLESLVERHLAKHFEQQYGQMSKELKKAPYRNIDYYYWQFWLAEVNHQNILYYDNRSTDDSLQKVIDQLDVYYISLKLHYHWLALNRQRVVQQEYNQGFFWDEINQHIQTTPLSEEVLIQLYKQMIDILQEPEKESHFTELRTLFKKEKAILVKEEQQQIYAVLINYCRWQSSKGATKYMIEALELYKEMLNEKLLYIGDYLAPHHFKNIVSLALQVDELTWADQFMQENWEEMHPSHASNVYAYNQAALFFHQQAFEEAASLLQQIQFSDYEFIDFYYHIGYKVLLIKTYYETEEEYPLTAALEALRIYMIRHKKIASNQRDAYLNFIKLCKRLMNEKRGKKRKSKDDLGEAISNTEPLFQRHWLLDKYAET